MYLCEIYLDKTTQYDTHVKGEKRGSPKCIYFLDGGGRVPCLFNVSVSSFFHWQKLRKLQMLTKPHMWQVTYKTWIKISVSYVSKVTFQGFNRIFSSADLNFVMILRKDFIFHHL